VATIRTGNLAGAATVVDVQAEQFGEQGQALGPLRPRDEVLQPEAAARLLGLLEAAADFLQTQHGVVG
jgi:hypothetical protein